MIDLRISEVLGNDDGRERVLSLHPEGRGAWLIDVDGKAASPFFRSTRDIEGLWEEGLLQPVKDPWASLRDPMSETQARRRDDAWMAIKPLACEQPQIFDARLRASLIAARTVETELSRYTLYRLLRRWWQRGMTQNALMPDYANSGAPGKHRASGVKKRGQPVQLGPAGMNVDEKVRAVFRDSVTLFLGKGSGHHKGKKKRLTGISECYHQCLKHFFSEKVVDSETGRQVSVLKEQHPSLRQFRYWLEQDHDLFALERRRRTPRVYDKDSRALLGSSLDEVAGPGSRFQIDATIADVYLVSRFDRSRIVGRPVVYVVIDVFSRMISGVYVGLENPSWVGAMTALANAATSKKDWCERFGVEIEDADWPCRSLPAVLLADRGEVLGSAADTLIQRFGMEIENTAPFRADWKGIVERRFGLLHAAFGPYVPGYVEPDFLERGARDYRLDAMLDVDEFTAIIINTVLYYNNEHVLGGYKRDPEMIADDVDAVPIDLWNWGTRRRVGLQRSFPQDLVKLALLPSDQAIVTAKGIRFHGVHYSCSRAIEEHWFEKARQTHTWKVDISYEPRLMDTIWLRDPKGHEPFEPCSLTVPSEQYRGRTLWEIDQLQKEDRRQRARREPDQRQARINRDSEVEAIVAAAAEKQPKDDRSKAARLRDIRGSRSKERAARRSEEALDLRPDRGPTADVLPFDGMPPQQRDEFELPDMETLRRRLTEQKEGDEDD